MASYTITTSRTQEVGIKWMYDTYASKTTFPTQAAYFQDRINRAVSDPAYADYVRAHAVALDKSVATIPEANRPAAQAEIEQVILENGGTLVPPGPTGLPPPVLPPPPPPAREGGTDGPA